MIATNTLAHAFPCRYVTRSPNNPGEPEGFIFWQKFSTDLQTLADRRTHSDNFMERLSKVEAKERIAANLQKEYGVSEYELKKTFRQIKEVLMLRAGSSSHLVTVAFRNMDRDHTGKIGAQEVYKYLSQAQRGSESMDKKVIDCIVDLCDNDGDGEVDYNELSKSELSSAATARSAPRSKARNAHARWHTVKQLHMLGASLWHTERMWQSTPSIHLMRARLVCCGDGSVMAVILCDDIIELLALVPDRTIKSKKQQEDARVIGFRRVTAKELQAAQQAIKTKLHTKYKNIATALRAIDTKGDGFLSREEVKEMLTKTDLLKHVDYYTGALHGEVSMAAADTLMDFVDKDGDGKLNYQEFQRILTAENILHIPPPKDPSARFGKGKFS